MTFVEQIKNMSTGICQETSEFTFFIVLQLFLVVFECQFSLLSEKNAYHIYNESVQ